MQGFVARPELRSKYRHRLNLDAKRRAKRARVAAVRAATAPARPLAEVAPAVWIAVWWLIAGLNRLA